ncbi:EVE domain-containing protein [Tuberibacillus sp. Marseille-P3662]|uniref:EVE domain-containing protein n=1 Tax=Tuberibacillus sp. Marseille-P3662 TaxID=1965358 RepID=UPI000A1CAAD4|nr:EVE domain-containing protein [Tuberibacillus sp. Marseille-P3662]
MIDQKIWFMVASDQAATFRWHHILETQEKQFWSLRKMPRNFKSVHEGDKILCYRSGSVQRGIVGLAEVEEAFNDEGIIVRGIREFNHDIPYYEFKHTQVYQTTEAGRMRNRGTLFAVTEDFAHWIKHRLYEKGDETSAMLLECTE